MNYIIGRIKVVQRKSNKLFPRMREKCKYSLSSKEEIPKCCPYYLIIKI